MVDAEQTSWNEQDRLAALRGYRILDTAPEAAFDDFARLAAEICEAPIAAVNLVDACRQWFKAGIGLGVRETPLDVSICAHAILQRDLFVVPDTTRDTRFARNPLVTGTPRLRFYAGALLETDNFLPLGTLCVLDYAPRPAGLTERQAFALRALARQVMAQMNLRLALQERIQADTRRERAEAELRRLNETLESRVREEVAAREVTQSRLAQAQRVQALGQLAGGIAHDFNNILQAVSGGVRLIERRLDDPEAVKRLLVQMGEATERGAAVTGRLLDFAHRDDRRPEPVDAGTLMASLGDMLASTIGGGIAVRVDAADGLPKLLVDKRQLETVLVNLATNARDAMAGAGTLTLAVGADHGGQAAVLGAALPARNFLRLSVTDTGKGIDTASLARVTEPFFTTKPSGEGTGLGLSMARAFAEQCGGGIQIASEPGRGTTVSLWLPCADAGLENGGRDRD